MATLPQRNQISIIQAYQRTQKTGLNDVKNRPLRSLPPDTAVVTFAVSQYMDTKTLDEENAKL
jgi:hypothetical protein